MIRDRPAQEIELTPAMIEAGVAALCLFDLREDLPEDIVPHVYLEMLRLEGRLFPSVDETFSAFSDGLVSPENKGATDE